MCGLRSVAFVLLLSIVSCQNLANVENYATDAGGRLTENHGGVISNGVVVLNRTYSPYWLTNDIIVERGAKLIIEPGVVVKVQPQVGITIRGILIARVSSKEILIFLFNILENVFQDHLREY